MTVRKCGKTCVTHTCDKKKIAYWVGDLRQKKMASDGLSIVFGYG